jgi:2-keto-3-deoxy-L-rhamnonate aldolase RhmA
MKENRFRRVLQQGGMPVGHMLMEFGTRGMAKILESADPDFVVIDMEHSGFTEERVADLIAWFKATDIAPFVRVPQPLYHFLARCLDAGALGVMVGNVETAEEAQSIVDSAKYAPMGRRGVGLGTAHNDFVMPKPIDYFEQANANTTVICQIESAKGVANAEAIASVPGVDVLWVGHFDLSHNMGIAGQFARPEFTGALASVVAAARAHGKLAAIQPGNLQQAEEWLRAGFHFLSWKSDIALYRAALQDELAKVRTLQQSLAARP